MPAHSNKVRMDFGVPVFDISTVGRCVMSAADTFRPIGVNDLFLALFRNPAFRDCITRLFDASFIEPKGRSRSADIGISALPGRG